MSAFNSAASSRDCPEDKKRLCRGSYRLTEGIQTLTNALFQDLQERCHNAKKSKSLVAYFSSLFEMKDMEVAAWCYLLRLQTTAHDSLSDIVKSLRMTGFYTKSLLGHDMTKYVSKLEQEDCHFQDLYDSWLQSSVLPTFLHLHDIHQTYTDLCHRIHSYKTPKNTNLVVDDIVQTEGKTVLQDEKRPKKQRKTEGVTLDLMEAPFLPVIPCTVETYYPSLELEELLFDVEAFLSS